MTGQQLDPTACGSSQELYALQKHVLNHSALTPKPYAFIPDFNGSDAIIMEYVKGSKIGEIPGNNRDENYATLLGQSIAAFHQCASSAPKFKVQSNNFKPVSSELLQTTKRLWQKGQLICICFFPLCIRYFIISF